MLKEPKYQMGFTSIMSIGISYMVNYPLNVVMIGAGIIGLGFEALEIAGSKDKKLFNALGILNNAKAQPKKISKQLTNYGYAVRYALPIGISIKQFREKHEELEAYFKRPIVIEYDNHKNILIKVYEKTLKKLYPFTLTKKNKPLEIHFAYTYGDKELILDLEECPHLMIAGSTGGGKTVTLTDIVMGLVFKKTVEIDIIDLKGNEFTAFEGVVNEVCTEITQAEKVLRSLKTEMEKRYKIFRRSEVKGIKEYNKRKHRLNYKVLIIDEYADLATKEGKACQEMVRSLSQKARGAGIHLILATQRDSADVIDGFIKNNIPSIIALRTANRVSSQVVLDRPGAENLTGNGHFILKHQGEEIEGRSMYITGEDCEKLLKELKNKNRNRNEINNNFISKPKMKNLEFLE